MSDLCDATETPYCKLYDAFGFYIVCNEYHPCIFEEITNIQVTKIHQFSISIHATYVKSIVLFHSQRPYNSSRLVLLNFIGATITDCNMCTRDDCFNKLDNIYALTLINCNLTDSILSQHFDFSKYFRTNEFQELTIQSMNMYGIDENSFIGFLTRLIILNTEFSNLQPNFLRQLVFDLEYLIMEYVPPYLNMDTIFSSAATYWKITSLTLKSKHSQMRTVASSNFTYLPHLEVLELSNCQIEVLLERAFDNIKQLYVLNLSENNLKEVPIHSLNRLINSLNIDSKLNIVLWKNTFNCTCTTEEWSSIVEMILYEQQIYLQVYMPCLFSFRRQHCPNLQIIHTKSVCIAPQATLSYPKIIIKADFDHNELIIKKSNQSIYRLFVQNLMNERTYNSKWGFAKCHKKGYLEQTLKCLILSNETESISLVNLTTPNVALRIICIHYVSVGLMRVWPLHCISHGIVMDENNGFIKLETCLMYVSFGCVGLFLLALISLLQIARNIELKGTIMLSINQTNS